MRILFIVLVALLVATPSFAYVLNNVIVEGSKAVTADSVKVGTSAKALAPSCSIYQVALMPSPYNTGLVFVGGTSGVTSSNGFHITGNAVTLRVDNLSQIYVISTNANDKITFLAEQRSS